MLYDTEWQLIGMNNSFLKNNVYAYRLIIVYIANKSEMNSLKNPHHYCIYLIVHFGMKKQVLGEKMLYQINIRLSQRG